MQFHTHKPFSTSRAHTVCGCNLNWIVINTNFLSQKSIDNNFLRALGCWIDTQRSFVSADNFYQSVQRTEIMGHEIPLAHVWVSYPKTYWAGVDSPVLVFYKSTSLCTKTWRSLGPGAEINSLRMRNLCRKVADMSLNCLRQEEDSTLISYTLHGRAMLPCESSVAEFWKFNYKWDIIWQ